MFVSRWSVAGMLTACVLSFSAHADEACEAFVSDAVHAAFDQIERQSAQDAFAAVQSTVEATVDERKLARFTLGRFAQTADEHQLVLYQAALTEYLSALLLDYFDGAAGLTLEVSRSVDRSARDCIAETIIHRDNQDDLILSWRVFRDAGNMSIVDVATTQGGNTLWLSIELRAQFAERLDRNGGDVEALIDELKTRRSGL